MVSKEDLFNGEGEPLGGLSNELELVKICPAEFNRLSNPWCDYANELFFNGGNVKEWKWKTSTEEEKRKQFNCLRAVLAGMDLPHEAKIALAGWMLSEIIFEIPTYK